MSFSIRHAVADDLPAIADIAITAYSGYVAAMGREPAPMRADFAAHLADDWLFVAEADSGIAGYMVLCEVNGAWWLDNIATAPECRGAGLGRLLVGWAEDWLSQRTDRVQLYTNVAMASNLGWYERLGYRQTGRRVVDGFDREYFEKYLTRQKT